MPRLTPTDVGEIIQKGLNLKGWTSTKTSNYTVTEGDYIVPVDTSSGAVTITLGSEIVAKGRVVIIKDVGGSAGANAITVATEGSETIDGGSTASISSNYGKLMLISDGSDWYSI